MEWKEFGIEEVARLCGIQMKNDGIGAREIKALCPFCGDKQPRRLRQSKHYLKTKNIHHFEMYFRQ